MSLSSFFPDTTVLSILKVRVTSVASPDEATLVVLRVRGLPPGLRVVLVVMSPPVSLMPIPGSGSVRLAVKV